MTTPSILYKYLEKKEFPVDVIYKSLYSVCWRLYNTRTRKRQCVSIKDLIDFNKIYGEYDERYPLQRDILLGVLDDYGIRAEYNTFKQNLDRTCTCINDLISAQYITKLVRIIYRGSYEVVGIPDSAKQGKDRNASGTLSEPLYYWWFSRCPFPDQKEDNTQVIDTAELKTIDAE